MDEDAFVKMRKAMMPSTDKAHVATCVFCQQPVNQCTCDQWAKYRQ